MMEKRTKDMIHEALEGGGRITQDKGHDQKLIVALMSSKVSLGNAFLFHMYLVISRTNIKFSKELVSTQFIQEIINEMNGKFVFNGKFFEGTEVKTHSPRTFFLQDHDHRRRVGSRTRADNESIKELLRPFYQFHFLGKRGGDTDEYWEKGFRIQGE
jgi:hypothetical protein